MNDRFEGAYTEEVIVPGTRSAPEATSNVVPIPRRVKRTIRVIRGASFDGKPVPSRPFHVLDMIPGNTVTILSGDGGTGKSLLALQLAVATVIGSTWCNVRPVQGACVYLSAEDDEDELHRRLFAIANGEGVGLDRLEDLHVVPLAGEDALLTVPDLRGGPLKPTPLFDAVERLIEECRPALIVLDTLADLFGGNEIDRAQARQFIGLLRSWAIRYSCAVLLLAHPSLTGIASGTGASGSTAWNNSVRSRLYLERIYAEGTRTEPDPDIRKLETKKANYGRVGAETRLRWRDGLFEPLDAPQETAFGAIAAQSRAEQLFLELLAAFSAEGQFVSYHGTANNFAPNAFSRDARAAGINKRAFDDAMSRLFASGRIRVGRSDGPPSRQKEIIVATSGVPR